MKFGICIPIRREVKPRANIETAKRAEELGFDSVWVSDHVVVPDKYVGRFSEVFYDPFILLASIAAQTNRIKLGTSVIILPYRNPIVVAKMIATLDALSNGRVIFGVGPGWMKEEFDILGASYYERGKITGEYIRIFKELWEKKGPKFKGEFFEFSNIKFYPKPVQKPHPPVWVGGNSERAIKRAALLGDGWQPTWVGPDSMMAGINRLKQIAEEAGRKLEDFTFSLRNRLWIWDEGKKTSGITDEGGAQPPYALFGTPDEIKNYIKEFEKIGVSHIVVDPVAKNDEEMFETMERFSREIMPLFKT